MSDRASRQDQIKSTPEQLFCTLKAADAGAWDWDICEDKVIWPAETFMQFGLDPEKGVPHFKEWLEQCVHPEDRERLAQYCKTALAGHESSLKIEYRIIHPEHSVRWLAARGSIERDLSCQPVRVRGLNIDITEQKEIEEKLRKSEERLALALKASSTGVWEWDCVTDKVTWSKECYDIHGLKSFGGTREAFARLVYPEDAERLWATFNSALANRTEYTAEFRIIRGDSEVRWVANSGIATYDTDGRPIRVLGTITDIHDRKLAEIQLAEREKQLKLFVENSPAAVAMFDTEMRYVNVSRRFMTERRLEGDLTGRSHYELFPNLPQDWLEAHRRVLNGEEMAADEDYFEWPDGTSDWMRWSMKPWRKEDGSIGGALLMTETVTAQVEARRRLAESEAKFRAAFENAAVGVAQTSPSGKFTLFNKRFLEFTGYSEAELLAKGFQDITHPDDLPAQNALIRGVLDGSADSYAMEKRYIRKDGSIAWITLTVGCVRKPDGAVDSFIGVIKDITERKKTEAALRESKDLLHYCLKVASAGVWDWNIPSGTVTWSPENYRLYGRDPSDGPLSYLAWLSCVHPEDRDGADTTVKEALEGRRPNFRIEFRITRSDGSVRWLVALGQVERASDGAPLRMSGINLDISELKQAEEALRQSEDRLRYALKAASAGTWDWDIVSGKAEWSPEAYVLYGRDPEDGPITHDFWLSCVHPNDREQAKIAVSKALSGKVPEYRTEFRVVRRDGSVRWLMALGLVERDADGTPVRMSGINIDISERKHAEEALRRSEEQFRGVFENAGNGIAITNMQGQFLSCNAAYASTIGYSEEELHALKFADLIHPEDKAENLALAWSLSRQEIANFEIENRYIAKDGRAVWVHKHASLVRNAAGKPKRMIALITDITERKRQEEQINLLMREVNHRSKNILTVVQAVARQTAASQPADFLRCFDERVRALAASQDLLVKSEWKGADLEELIRSQLAHFKDFIDTRFVLSGPPLVVTASTAQALGMALHELATNAGKYGALSNANGYVCIDWKLERDGTETMFTMSWREHGGPPVQAPEKRGFGSTVICRMAERSLGAKVELLYERAGVSWRIRCPASEIVDGDRSAALQRGKLVAKESAGFRPKILVVEDDALVGLEIDGVLCGAGFDVLGPARSVAEALELLTASSSDGAVLDIRLGHETSEPVAKALLDRRIPFVTLSGFSKEQRPSAFDGTPALMKPLEAELLIAQLKRCIEEQRAAKVT